MRSITLQAHRVVSNNWQSKTAQALTVRNEAGTVRATAVEAPAGSGNYVATWDESALREYGYWHLNGVAQADQGLLWLGPEKARHLTVARVTGLAFASPGDTAKLELGDANNFISAVYGGNVIIKAAGMTAGVQLKQNHDWLGIGKDPTKALDVVGAGALTTSLLVGTTLGVGGAATLSSTLEVGANQTNHGQFIYLDLPFISGGDCGLLVRTVGAGRNDSSVFRIGFTEPIDAGNYDIARVVVQAGNTTDTGVDTQFKRSVTILGGDGFESQDSSGGHVYIQGGYNSPGEPGDVYLSLHGGKALFGDGSKGMYLMGPDSNTLGAGTLFIGNEASQPWAWRYTTSRHLALDYKPAGSWLNALLLDVTNASAAFAGPVSTNGGGAQFAFEERDSPGTHFIWYALGGLARLYHGSDILTIDATGNAYFTGRIDVLSAVGDCGVRVRADATNGYATINLTNNAGVVKSQLYWTSDNTTLVNNTSGSYITLNASGFFVAASASYINQSLRITRTAAANPILYLDAVGAPYGGTLVFCHGATNLWQIQVDATEFRIYDYHGTPGTRVTLANATGDATFTGSINAGGNITANGYVKAVSHFYGQANLYILNKAASGWLVLGERNTAEAEALWHLSNIGNITLSGLADRVISMADSYPDSTPPDLIVRGAHNTTDSGFGGRLVLRGGDTDAGSDHGGDVLIEAGDSFSGRGEVLVTGNTGVTGRLTTTVQGYGQLYGDNASTSTPLFTVALTTVGTTYLLGNVALTPDLSSETTLSDTAGSITVLRAGRYMVHFSCTYGINQNNVVTHFGIYKNGSGGAVVPSEIENKTGTTSDQTSVAKVCIVDLAANDVLTVRADCDTANRTLTIYHYNFVAVRIV